MHAGAHVLYLNMRTATLKYEWSAQMLHSELELASLHTFHRILAVRYRSYLQLWLKSKE